MNFARLLSELYPALVSRKSLLMKATTTAGTGRNTKPTRATRATQPTAPDGKWRSFPKVPNTGHFVRTGAYFGRVKIGGKLFRESCLSRKSQNGQCLRRWSVASAASGPWGGAPAAWTAAAGGRFGRARPQAAARRLAAAVQDAGAPFEPPLDQPSHRHPVEAPQNGRVQDSQAKAAADWRPYRFVVWAGSPKPVSQSRALRR